MNLSWGHAHLILNHFPIVGSLFALILLVYAVIKNSRELKWVSLWSLVILALITLPVYYSGLQAVTLVPDAPGAIILAHRQRAETATIAFSILGAMGVLGLLSLNRSKGIAPWFLVSLLAVAAIATALMAWTGLQGGMIRHPEVRGELELLIDTPQTQQPATEAEPGSEQEHDHSHE